MRHGEIFHRSPHSFSQLQRTVGFGTRQHNYKFLAAIPRYQVAGADLLLHRTHNTAQTFISPQVPIDVVVGLEQVDIHNQQR